MKFEDYIYLVTGLHARRYDSDQSFILEWAKDVKGKGVPNKEITQAIAKARNRSIPECVRLSVSQGVITSWKCTHCHDSWSGGSSGSDVFDAKFPKQHGPGKCTPRTWQQSLGEQYLGWPHKSSR